MYSPATALSSLSSLTSIPEAPLHLLITLALEYPLAQFYTVYFLRPLSFANSTNSSSVRNAFLLATGLLLSLFYNGIYIIHSLVTVFTSYAFLRFLPSRHMSVAAVFVLNLVHLLVGYALLNLDPLATFSDSVAWTVPQCILCLRLIGFAFDYMDGAADKPEKSSAVYPLSFPEHSPLRELPPLTHLMGYCYFPAAFMVGPQFSFALYRDFITLDQFKKVSPEGDVKRFDIAPFRAAQVKYAMQCALAGVVYLAAHQIGEALAPMEYLVTDEYKAKGFLVRLWYMWWAGKTVLAKYFGVWKLNEGACVLFGISLAGFDAQHNPDFTGLANVNLTLFETATSTSDLISSFNVNTNHWAKRYLFKRLRFLNSKHISSAGALFFLAIWHGTRPGYFLNFSLEFLDVEAERVLGLLAAPLWSAWPEAAPGQLIVKKVAKTIVAWLLTSGCIYYALVSFALLDWTRSITAWTAVYFVGHVVVIGILVAGMVLKPKKTAKREKMTNGEMTNGAVNGGGKKNQ